MAKLPKRLCFDLANPFSGNTELSSDFLQRAGFPIIESEPTLQYLFLAGRQTVQDLIEMSFQKLMSCFIVRRHSRCRNKIAKVTILFISDRGLERCRLLGNFDDLLDFCRFDLECFCDLFNRWLTSEFLHQSSLRSNVPINSLNHVYGNTNCPRLVSDCPCDCLPDPPCGVGGKLKPSSPIVLLHCTNKSNVSFLNEIKKRKASPNIFFRDRNNKTKIRFDKFVQRRFIILFHSF